QRADVVKAVSTGNGITMSELLGPAAQSADLDGILVVDAKLRVIGADTETIELLATSQTLAAHPIARELQRLFAENNRKHPRSYEQATELTAGLAAAVGVKTTAPLAAVAVVAIFDDFGDVFAALIAHRALRPHEAALEEFSRLEGAG